MSEEVIVQPNTDEAVAEPEQIVADQPEGASPDLMLARVRDLVLAAHPDVVPEMIQGETFDDLMASVEPAREAYQRIVSEQHQRQMTPRVAAQPGHRSTSLVDVESLSPLGKISEGLRRA